MTDKMVTITEERFLELLEAQNRDNEEWDRRLKEQCASIERVAASCHPICSQEEYDSLKADAERWRQFDKDTDKYKAVIPCTQMDKDLELGRLVRQMPTMSGLIHSVDMGGESVWDFTRAIGAVKVDLNSVNGTPEEALRAGLGKVLPAECETPKENEDSP